MRTTAETIMFPKKTNKGETPPQKKTHVSASIERKFNVRWEISGAENEHWVETLEKGKKNKQKNYS